MSSETLKACPYHDGWMPMETAPRNRTRILAITGQLADERFEHWSNREFVVFYINDLSGWSLFPGMGCSDDWFAGWRPLYAEPVARIDHTADLLAALQEAVDLIERISHPEKLCDPMPLIEAARCDVWLMSARAAIAKAGV